jgi:hypothetical protein
VLAWYTPQTGDPVQVMRRDNASWLVLGTTRTSNPTTVAVGRSWGFPYNITPATPPPVGSGGPANPYVVAAGATHSWRDSEGWSVTIGDTVGQGAFSTQYGYYRGCYFYGDTAFAALAGRTCTRLRIKIVRTGAGGLTGGTQQIIAPHAHGSQPANPPYFIPSFGTVNAGSVAWSSSGTFDLPVSWGQALIDGTARGLGHLLLAAGNGNYSLNAGKSADSTTGQLTIDWA